MTSAGPRRNATKSGHFLHTSHCALHTSRFTLHTCTSHSTLHLISNHVSSSHIISPHLSSSHLAPSLLTCHLSKFFLTAFISSGHWPTFLISPKFFSTHLSSSAREKDRTVKEKSLEQKTHWAQKAFAQRSLRHRCIYTQKSFKHTCTTKLAQSTSQYYFVHSVLPSTTVYYKACRKHFPVLLCTTKLAQSTSQYHFVLQSLHKALPSTTLYYKACTKHFPVLLCTTQLAQTTSQYYFVLQSLHMSTDHDNNHAAITLRSAAKDSASAGIYAQPLIAEHRGGTDCPSSRSDPQRPHARAAHHRWLHPLYTENTRCRSLAFSPTRVPCNIHATTLECILQHRVANPHVYTHMATKHGNKTCQQSCSHYNAICNHRFQNTLALRTHDEPSIAKHHQGTNHTPKQTDCTPRTRGTFHRRPKRLYTEKHFVLRHPPQTKAPCNMHTAITLCFAATRIHPCSHCNAI